MVRKYFNSIKTISLTTLFVIISAAFLTGCKEELNEDILANQTIKQIITEGDNFSLLERVLVRTNLLDSLADGSFTVFAPSNDAFIAAGYRNENDVNDRNVDSLRRLIRYHIFNGTTPTEAISAASNRPLVMIDSLTAYTTKNDTGVYINGARFLQADVDAINGVIHVIDRVLSVPLNTTAVTVGRDPSLTLLNAALVRTNLTARLADRARTVTLFAPSNEAFSQAGFASVQEINSANLDSLTAIISYHIVPLRLYTPDLIPTTQFTTLSTGRLTVQSVTVDGITLKGIPANNTSNISRANISTANGVTHTINRLLLPQ